MSKYIKSKKLIGSLGFSLVELMVTLGIAGAGAIGFMQLQKSQVTGQKKSEVKYDANAVANSIGNILVSEESCAVTFNGTNFSSGTIGSVTEIKSKNPVSGGERVMYSSTQAAGTPYISGGIEIDRYEYELTGPLVGSTANQYGTFNLAVVYKNNSKLVNDSREYKQEIPFSIKVETDALGNFISCYSAVDDIGNKILIATCKSIGGVYQNDACRLANHTFTTGQISDLTADSSVVLHYENFRDEFFPNLLQKNFIDKKAGTGVTENNTIQKDLRMDSGTRVLIKEVSTDASVINRTYMDELFKECEEGQVSIITADGLKCKQLLCANAPSGGPQYLVGFNGDGSEICVPLVVDSENSCPDSGRLGVTASGSLEYQCCTADCSGAENHCEGQIFNDGNDCATCIGTKPKENANWGAWIDTGATRQKAGATCSASCGGGTIALEKEQERTCLDDQACGGATCVGNSHQWVNAGTSSCNTQACVIASWTWSGATKGSCGTNCRGKETQVCDTGNASDCTGAPKTRDVNCTPDNRCCAPGGIAASVPAGAIYGSVIPGTKVSGGGTTYGGGSQDGTYCLNYYTLNKCIPGSNTYGGWTNYSTKGDGSTDYSYEYCSPYEGYGGCQSTGKHCSMLPTYNYCYVVDGPFGEGNSVRRVQSGLNGTSYKYGEYGYGGGPAAPGELMSYSTGYGIICISTKPSPAPTEIPWN